MRRIDTDVSIDFARKASGITAIASSTATGLRAAGKIPHLNQYGKAAENIRLRTQGDPHERVSAYTELILGRHTHTVPKAPIKRKVNNALRRLNNPENIPTYITKNQDFMGMRAIIKNPSLSPEERNQAFTDLSNKIMRYKNYAKRIQDEVRTGVNADEITQLNKIYDKFLSPKLFENPGGELPQLPSPLKMRWVVDKKGNPLLELTYERSELIDGKEVTTFLTKDFGSYELFKTYQKQFL